MAEHLKLVERRYEFGDIFNSDDCRLCPVHEKCRAGKIATEALIIADDSEVIMDNGADQIIESFKDQLSAEEIQELLYKLSNDVIGARRRLDEAKTAVEVFIVKLLKSSTKLDRTVTFDDVMLPVVDEYRDGPTRTDGLNLIDTNLVGATKDVRYFADQEVCQAISATRRSL